MNARNISEPEMVPIYSILERVHTGKIMLPRFQRRIAWNEGTSAMLIESILNGNPVGLFLTLQVGEGKKDSFVTREVPGAPSSNHNKCEELLLDGQQRIMSLYRAIKGNFNKPFIVEIKQLGNDEKSSYEINVHRINKELDVGKVSDEITNYFFPVALLSQETKSREARKWIRNHAEKHGLDVERFEDAYWDIRTKFMSFRIPIIKLPKTTTRERAINIFIQMNQSVAKLSAFDIAVAQMEEEVKESLHERVRRIADKTRLLGNLKRDDDAKKERKIGDFALRTFCLRQEQSPTEGSFLKLDFKKIHEEWGEFEEGVKRMNILLSQEKVWDQKRLPSRVPLHVIVALFMKKRLTPNTYGLYTRVLKKYLWRAFLSNRYSYAANKHMKDDYDSLYKLLNESNRSRLRSLESKVPMFKKSLEIPEIKDIQEAGWPSRQPHLGKAILILTLKEGAKDIATESSPMPDTIDDDYQYHHIYPKGYMEGITNSSIDSAINCMLLGSPTNNDWKDKAPSEYLMEIMKESEDVPAEIRRELLSEKLKTHIVPIDILLDSKAKKDSTEKEREKNFKEFVTKRSEEIHFRIKEMYKLEFS